MSYFTSKRERNLWLWTLAVMLAIYTTLGFAGTLAQEVVNRNITVNLFLLGCFLFLGTVILLGVRFKPNGYEIGVALGVFTAYVFIPQRMMSPIERSHLIEYGVVAVFIFEALRERKKNGRHVFAPWLLAIIATSILGAIDELIQLGIPSRVFDTNDIVFNFTASVMGVGGNSALIWAKAQGGKGKDDPTAK